MLGLILVSFTWFHGVGDVNKYIITMVLWTTGGVINHQVGKEGFRTDHFRWEIDSLRKFQISN